MCCGGHSAFTPSPRSDSGVATGLACNRLRGMFAPVCKLKWTVRVVLLYLGGSGICVPAIAAEPPVQISESQARILVETVWPPSPRISLEASPNNSKSEGPGKDFYGFEVIGTTPIPGGGAHVTGYVVNRWTGDVWEIQGSWCRRVNNASLHKQLRSLRARLHLTRLEYERLRILKPLECD
jgi:hypothetical protein